MHKAIAMINTPIDLVVLAMLLTLAVYVLARRRTRSMAGAALLVATSGLIAVLELSGWRWQTPAEGAVLGLAGWLAYSGPAWLLANRGFAAQYAAVDQEVRKLLRIAEDEWRSGQIDDAEYSRRFDLSNVSYRALKPPPGEWREIIDERIRIREEWSRVFENPGASPAPDELGEAEDALRRRIARAAG
jgi:hypothetical protein